MWSVAPTVWGDLGKGNSVLAPIDNSAAASDANFRAGQPSAWTMLARHKELEIIIPCTVAALLASGRRNAVADALSRFGLPLGVAIQTPNVSSVASFGCGRTGSVSEWAWA